MSYTNTHGRLKRSVTRLAKRHGTIVSLVTYELDPESDPWAPEYIETEHDIYFIGQRITTEDVESGLFTFAEDSVKCLLISIDREITEGATIRGQNLGSDDELEDWDVDQIIRLRTNPDEDTIIYQAVLDTPTNVS